MKFSYQRYEVEVAPGFSEGILYRPEIPIRVIGLTGDASFLALVDTGADGTVLPRAVGEAVGAIIDDQHTTRVTGVAGQELTVSPGEVEFELRSGRKTYRWRATIGFADFSSSEAEQALLGHSGFLNLMRATFDGERHELVIKPTDELARRVKE